MQGSVQLVRNRSRHDFSSVRTAGRMSVTADLPDVNLWLALVCPPFRGRTKILVRSVRRGRDTAGIPV